MEVHDINTRYNCNLHLPSTNRSRVQKGVLFSGSKIYNHLPLNIKLLSNDIKAFKSALKMFFIVLMSIMNLLLNEYFT
jgi:hypothetical protein